MHEKQAHYFLNNCHKAERVLVIFLTADCVSLPTQVIGKSGAVTV